jgi:hypothetical protein
MRIPGGCLGSKERSGVAAAKTTIAYRFRRARISVATINFQAGTIKRAPAGMQRWGFEWLWRIKEEPQLWKRYRDDGVAFL